MITLWRRGFVGSVAKGLTTIVIVTVCLAGCDSSAKKLAVASQAVAHALTHFEDGEQLAVKQGFISAQEDVTIQRFYIQLNEAGLALDTAIRANKSNPDVAAQLNNYLQSFQTMVSQGVGNIKNENTRQSLLVALQGAESALAVIASVVGSNPPAPTTAAKGATP